MPAVNAAVGFAQDPDADRLAIVDETGQYIGEELTLALAASRRLEQQRGPVVLNLSTSRVTEDIAARLGCPVFRAPVGEINVVERMIAENAVLGGEGNGGVIEPRVGYVRDSFVAMALVLDLLAATGLPLSRLVAGLPRYCMVKQKFPLGGSAGDSQPQRQPGDNGRGLWQRIAGRYPEARADYSDGLRLDWDDRWAHVPRQQYRADHPGDLRGTECGGCRGAGPRSRQLRRRSKTQERTMSHSIWPTFDRPPAVAFVDVDGTLLAETTTFLLRASFTAAG